MLFTDKRVVTSVQTNLFVLESLVLYFESDKIITYGISVTLLDTVSLCSILNRKESLYVVNKKIKIFLKKFKTAVNSVTTNE